MSVMNLYVVYFSGSCFLFKLVILFPKSDVLLLVCEYGRSSNFYLSSQRKKFVSLTKGILLKCVLFCFSPISMNCIKVSNHFLSLYSFF